MDTGEKKNWRNSRELSLKFEKKKNISLKKKKYEIERLCA